VHTPTHAALNFLALGRKPDSPRGWILLGAVLPDAPMFGFFLYESLVRGESAERIFRELYFEPGWQTLFDVFHSIPLFLVLAAAFWWWRNRRGLAFALSLLLHAVVDWPTHLEDAHAYLWPFWREPLPGFISYWHRGSFLMLELALILGALAWWMRDRFVRDLRAPSS
jgi:hypothetical protein